MVSCADDRTIKLWDLKSGDCIHTFYEPKVYSRHFKFSSVIKIFNFRLKAIMLNSIQVGHALVRHWLTE